MMILDIIILALACVGAFFVSIELARLVVLFMCRGGK
jgi:hypothetical protein